MRIIILVIAIMSCFFAKAATYYISPTGNNNNSGSILTPWKTWERISAPRYNTILRPGDFVYIRGGNYSSPHYTSGDDGVACYWQYINGNVAQWITIQNYPGEHPIFDCSNMTPYYSDPFIITMRNCSYVHVKGLHLRNLAQLVTGAGMSRGFELKNSPNCILEQIEVDHIGGSGFICTSSNNVLYINCDAHNNADPYTEETGSGIPGSDALENADGFNRTNNNSDTITYTGCRAWMNSDDGWDCLLSDGLITWHNCWAFMNGYYQQPGGNLIPGGNGEGFKLGNVATENIINTTTRFLNNCLAFDNADCGFNQSGTPTTLYQVYNCTAYRNNVIGFEFGFFESYPGEEQTFKNNIAYANGLCPIRYCAGNSHNINNTWTGGTVGAYCRWSGGINLTDRDFQSVDTAGVSGPRQIDGKLPYLPFLRLAPGSALIDAGINVPLPFYGRSQDIGAYEYGPSIKLNLFLQGYYAGGRLMRPVLNNQAVSGSLAMETDTITVSLYDPSMLDIPVVSNKGILHTDGTVCVEFPSTIPGSYYMAVKHRNTIETWSSATVTISNLPALYDFTIAANNAFGKNMIEVENGTWAMYTGDLNQDEFIDAADFGIFDTDYQNAVQGEYVSTDFNGDGYVDVLDFLILKNNSKNGIYGQHP